MRNLRQMRRYGYETPQPSLLSRIAGAVKKQLMSAEDREELLVTGCVCLVIGIFAFLTMVLLPYAIEYETDHSRHVVAESRGEK